MSDAQMRERLRPIVESYGRPQAALAPAINSLLDAGEGVGADAVNILADVCGVEAGAVEALLSQYRSKAAGSQFCDLLCLGTVCRLEGAGQVYESLCSEPGGVEGLAGVVVPSTCLGHCYAAPVLKLRDGTLHKVTQAGPQD